MIKIKLDGMYANKCCINGYSGYMVVNYWHGKGIARQFVLEDDYEEFCERLGFEPIMIEKESE